MTDRSFDKLMVRALELAARGKGRVSPNPLVGAVIYKSDKVIGEGSHAGPGRPHAEIVALRKAGAQAKGATLVVNLEPCCHTGRTGPCTDAIIKAGIKRVIYALKDPDPRVNGKGLKALRQAGIEVIGPVLKNEAAELNEFYLTSRKLGRPFVILKSAQTLDGQIASKSGDSKWISTDSTLKFGHQLRSEIDAVVIGGGTVRKDNPELTVRRVKGRNPYRIILTSNPSSLTGSKLLNATDGKTIVASTRAAIASFKKSNRNEKLIYWEVPAASEKQLDESAFVSQADQFGLISLLIEGGSKLATSFMNQHLVDKYHCLISPKLIGEGTPSLGDLGLTKVSEAIAFERVSYQSSGPDMIFTGYPCWREK